jgi:hypothetical protein
MNKEKKEGLRDRQAQETAENPQFPGWKWCDGKCERFLPPESFYPHRWSGRFCVPCHRYESRKSRRRYYRANAKAIRAQRRAAYQSNRESECAYQRDRYWRRKVAA